MALTINGTTGISGVDGSASAASIAGTDSNTGLSFASDTVNINTGGSTRATFDANGKLGIGDASPAAGLDVKVDTNPVLAIDRGSANNSNFNLQYNGTLTGQLSAANADFQVSAVGASVPISLYTNGTERMKLHSNGAISVGTNDSNRSFTLFNPISNDTIFRVQNNVNNEDTGLEILYVADSVTRTMRMGGYVQANSQNFQIANTEGITFYTDTGTGTHERFILAKNGDVNAQGIYDSTTSVGTNVNVHSDGHLRRSTSSRRYKNTITDATHGLKELLKLKSVTFKGNDEGDTVYGGLIAEDVHDAGLTEFVQYDKDNQPDALSYGNMVALCVKSIQELTSKVETLETEKTKMQTDLTALTARVTALEAA